MLVLITTPTTTTTKYELNEKEESTVKSKNEEKWERIALLAKMLTVAMNHVQFIAQVV